MLPVLPRSQQGTAEGCLIGYDMLHRSMQPSKGRRGMGCKSEREREAGCGRGRGTCDLQPTLSHDDDAIFSLSPSLPPTLLSPPQLSPQISMQSCRMMHANKSSRLQSHHCHLLVLGFATYCTYHMAITITIMQEALICFLLCRAG